MERTNHASDLAIHWDLDPDVMFLNHGSFGACPRPVLAYQAELRALLERQPVHFFAREAVTLLDQSRRALARFVGVPPEDLVFVRNATTGANAVLRSLALEPGDELLTTNHTYGACKNTLDYVAGRAGARVVVVKVPFPLDEPAEVLPNILAGVSDKTRLALLDHVTSATGLKWPLAEIISALAERGVDTLVDGAHAPGMLDLDIASLGPAYYTANCHKWLCAPKGAGFLYVRPDRQAGVRPVVISHGATATDPHKSRFQHEFDWVGTDDLTPALCVGRAIEVMGGLVPGGWPEIRMRNHALAVAGRDILCRALGLGKTPAPEAMLGSLASVPLPPGEAAPPWSQSGVDPLHDRLLSKHKIEVPVFPWPGPGHRLLRISTQLYNSEQQIRHLAEALSAEL